MQKYKKMYHVLNVQFTMKIEQKIEQQQKCIY